METNSGSSQPNTGPVLVPLEHYGHFMSARLRGGKKHREILGGGEKPKTRQKDNKSLLPMVHMCLVFLFPRSSLPKDT